MRFLVSLAPEKVPADSEADRWAPAGEPVVPWYPATAENIFLSTVTFRRAQRAKVVEDGDLSLDDIAQRLKDEYTGLPGNLHDNYVLAVAKAAYKYPIGTTFQIFVDQDSAKLKVVGHEDYYLLWDTQPLK